MECMDLYNLFRRFLEDRGCEKEFEEAFAGENPGYVLNAALWNILGGDEFFLGRAFNWSATKEGRAYWAAIDREWQERCQTNT